MLAIDPILPNALMWRAMGKLDAGDLDGADHLMLRASDLGLAFAGLGISAVADARGRNQEAAEALLPPLRAVTRDFPPGSAELLVRGFYGDAEARAKALAVVDAYLTTRPAVVSGIAPYALLRLGQLERGLALFQAAPTKNDAMVFNLLWGPEGRAARALPAFGEFARKAGLADYWERHGAPDLCHRVAPREYRCD